MTTEGGGAAQEQKPATNGTPSPGKRSVSKAKRLLPMELRKRRRAAKLQVSAEKRARVALGATPSPQTPPKPASPLSKATATDGAREEKQPGQASREDESTELSSAKATKEASPSKLTLEKPPLLPAAATATTSTRLHSLYTSSLLNHKLQRRQFVPGANVPNTFHVAELPLDIVPKTKLTILTAFPYPFQRVNSKTKQEALQSFISGGGSTQQSASQSTAVRWQQALHYFVHPAESVPTSLLLNRATAGNTSKPLLGGPKGQRKREEKAFFTARWNTWQEAFRDVYMNSRRPARSSTGSDAPGGSFYLRSSEFVVYFLCDADSQDAAENRAPISNLCRQHDEETEDAKKPTEESKPTKRRSLRAVMSQSSARIRKALHHLNVAYTMPYIKANETQREVGEFHLLEEELEASRKRNKDRNGDTIIAPVTRGTPAPENMHGADSLLLFYGHNAVHGLYEFLINRAPMSNQDVPELFALHPFANASIQNLHVSSFGRVGAAATEPVPEDQPSRSATFFRIEIAGFCFPSSVARLLAVLKDEWEASNASYGSLASSTTENSTMGGKHAQVALQTYMEAVAGAERLNAVKLDEHVTRGHGEKRGDQQERQTRQQELEFSKRRMEIALVTKVESRYDVETTTRAIAVRRGGWNSGRSECKSRVAPRFERAATGV
ncbi:hypothetical protein PHYPSEUDO_002895 [Phytophthora pseudosyringae]|uniref:Uncharacterized protein n=1 Tax=Phytophthora pseudosyringae TaxID=221518 RepID=A0A8T1VSK2_9STRA|nr:hypothetical protein PHYPSEUDO_002895 [Phytophthora pseudosyringae]